MTTGRINQVARSSSRSERSLPDHRRSSVSGICCTAPAACMTTSSDGAGFTAITSATDGPSSKLQTHRQVRYDTDPRRPPGSLQQPYYCQFGHWQVLRRSGISVKAPSTARP
ncbi:hypothetical protein M514_28112 [Trichuris suis]|uniref:Uncharacterized protein n=1 Tax=Trichuris suis TaxID=68888 RepID=A0A085MR66_9BILA|nr:hypothetical protein M514_28112 [Trichuris suis]